MSRIVDRFKEFKPLASPTPRTAPTSVWVVDTGKASLDANTIVIAAPNSAAKPLVGVSSVIHFPIVSMTRHPMWQVRQQYLALPAGELTEGPGLPFQSHLIL